MTQPDNELPTTAFNYGSLHDLAGRDEADWNAFINAQALAGHADLLTQLYDGLPQNQGINLQSVFIQQMFQRLFNCNPGGVDLTSTLDLAQASVADNVGGLNGDPNAPFGINLFQTLFGFFCGCTPAGTTMPETMTNLTTNVGNTIGAPLPADTPLGIGAANTVLNRFLPGVPQGNSLTQTLDTAHNGFSDLMALLGNPFGLGTNSTNKSTQIPWERIIGISGPVDLGSSLQTAVDYLWSAFSQADGHGKTLSLLFGAAAQLTQYSASAVALGEHNSELWFNRAVTKPTYLAIDPSADAVFNISTLSGTAPTFVNVASTKSVIGILGTPDAGIKESVCWIGQSTTNVTGIYIRIYSIDLSTGAFNLLHESANLIADVDNALEWNYYNLPSSAWFNAAQNTWYAVEMVTTGSGTYQVVGMPNHWLTPNLGTIPKGMAAEMSSPARPAPATIANPTYSVNVPWFALVGVAGISAHAPKLTVFGDAGTFIYQIPSWATDIVVVAVGAGGGGQACGILWGEGGRGGHWASTHLVRGVDIPLTTTLLTVSPGLHGANGINFGGSGGTGNPTTVSAIGWGGISAAGGAGGVNGNADYSGKGPGNTVFETNTYYGGNQQNGFGVAGIEPGGGGSGGTIIFLGAGDGADGAVWVTAIQAI